MTPSLGRHTAATAWSELHAECSLTSGAMPASRADKIVGQHQACSSCLAANVAPMIAASTLRPPTAAAAFSGVQKILAMQLSQIADLDRSRSCGPSPRRRGR